jgi:hypothetical protein
MKQKLDEVRTLAAKLFKAGQKEKRKQPKEVWGNWALQEWHDLPSESVALWDAISICAYREVDRDAEWKRWRKGLRDNEA